MKPRHKRAAIVIGVLAAIGTAVALVLNAFNSNLVFFYTPSQIASRPRWGAPSASAVWCRPAALHAMAFP